MDNPIAPLDRSTLYPGSAHVKQAQEADKEKERKKFSEELESELDDEEQKRKKKDSLVLESVDPETAAEDTVSTPESTTQDGEQDAPRHVDLTA